MSFTAFLLPLRPHLTYYQYSALKNISPRAFLPGALPVGARCKRRAGRKTPEPGRVSQLSAPLPTRPRLQSALHTSVQLFLDLLTSLDLVWLPCPLHSPRFSVVPRLIQ